MNPLSKEMVQKVIRLSIVILCFTCLISIAGIKTREAQQCALALGVMIVFGLLLRNIWLTLFFWWTLFLFAFYKFEYGSIYVSNIFYGCILYYLTKLAFGKKHINFFINGVLWLVFINIIYMSVQLLGFDFIYMANLEDVIIQNKLPLGFMSNSAYTGFLMAIGIPLLATRGTKLSVVASLGLFVPLSLCQSAMCLVAGVIAFLFVTFFKIPRKIWIILLICLIAGSIYYTIEKDTQSYFRFDHWKKVLYFSKTHPIVGWGLDSYRSVTKEKQFLFYYTSWEDVYRNSRYILTWDNPHNLYVSLVFEFGIISLLILGGYLRQCGIRFSRAVKEPNTIALMGVVGIFFLVSGTHFPIFLARCAVFIIPMFALFEVQTNA